MTMLAPQPLITEPRVRKRELRNLKTSWIEAGNPSGPLLVLLHGFPDSAETWENQIQFFKSRFHLICPYVRGADPSEGAREVRRYSTQSEALDILQIIQTVDPKHERQIFLVGHDLGAPVAWKLATFLGSRILGLVILNGLSLEQMARRLRQRPKQLLKSWYVFPMLVPYLPEFVFGHFAKPLLKIAEKSGGFPKPTEEANSYAHRRIVSPLNQYRAFVKELLAVKTETAAKLHIPTLVLWSNHDKYLIHPTMEELEPFASKVTVRILVGHHWIHHQNPELVNAVMDDFFSAQKNKKEVSEPK